MVLLNLLSIAYFHVFQVNSNLKEISLLGNNLECVACLEEGLRCNNTLKILHLQSNLIEDVSGLGNAMETNRSLVEL